MNGHNVVIASPPKGQYGTNSAAIVAKQMQRSFPSVRLGLMVGIGGGVPSRDKDIRLGDVVVSQPDNGHGGVVQYDMGKATPGEFKSTGFLNTPPGILLSAVAIIEVNGYKESEDRLPEYLSKITQKEKFRRDAAGEDI